MAEGWVATYEDSTERRQAEAKIQYMAHHDALTNLPNRRTFYERLNGKLARIPTTGVSIAVHCIDLDFFKNVNDTLGHPAGDALLEACADRLRSCVRRGDLVARLGGDEFAILQAAATADSAVELAQRVLHAIAQPYELAGRQAVVGASIGIALDPGGIAAQQLFTNADLALYNAKEGGRNTIRMFEAGMEAAHQARYSIEIDLRTGLQRQELELHYQPIVDLGSERVSGYEALVRWRSPSRGLVMPGEFIGIAEATGLIGLIGEWVIRQACFDAANWLSPVKVAVNLSSMQLRTREVITYIRDALSESGLTPNRLELEITESVFLEHDNKVVAILHELRELGARTVLDDFGTGYSSLSYLRSFPFDKIKMDQSFIRDMGSQPDCLAIVDAVSGLARTLGMTTTAEGVETKEQMDKLRELGFDEVQGYLLGRPAPNDLIEPRAYLARDIHHRPPRAAAELARIAGRS
jgi:diguanylate cyclase (GGDEF)-like protein